MSHVAVIGAGIVGLCAARELRARGHDVTVIERGEERRDGVSFGNAGIVVPSHFVPLAAPGVVGMVARRMLDPAGPVRIAPRLSADLASWGVRFLRSATEGHVRHASPALAALNLASRRLHERMADDLGRDLVRFEASGLLMLCRTDAALRQEARVAEAAPAFGVRAEILDAADVRAAEPDVELDVVGAVRFPDDARADPAATMRALQRRLDADPGVRFLFGTEVLALQRHRRADRAGEGGIAVLEVRRTGDRSAPVTTIDVDGLVLAAGAWSAPLARDLGLRLLLQPGKGYGLTMPLSGEEPPAVLRSPAILVEAHASATRVADGFRVGGTMEFAGFDPAVGQARLAGLKRAVRSYLPGLTSSALDGAAVWSGFRPVSPDGLPYLGLAPRAPNAVVATGHAMMGFSAGPISGRVAAQLLDGEPPDVEVRAFDPARHTWAG
ncbi:MAG: FAD-dependent oxidoreductase [Trueperaceae bacterium]